MGAEYPQQATASHLFAAKGDRHVVDCEDGTAVDGFVPEARLDATVLPEQTVMSNFGSGRGDASLTVVFDPPSPRSG